MARCAEAVPAPDGCRSRSRRGERAKRRRCRRRNVRRDGARRSVAGRRTTTSDLGSPSRRGAIIRSSLIKLREMSKDSAMPARRTMRTQIITSHGRPVLLSSTSSTSSTSTCIRVYVYTSPLSISFVRSLLSSLPFPNPLRTKSTPWKLYTRVSISPDGVATSRHRLTTYNLSDQPQPISQQFTARFPNAFARKHCQRI